MAASVNNCIQTPFVNGCHISMTQLDGTWSEDFDHIESMTGLPEINNTMAYSTRNVFLHGQITHPVKLLCWLIIPFDSRQMVR